jgi:hypothetical protein
MSITLVVVMVMSCVSVVNTIRRMDGRPTIDPNKSRKSYLENRIKIIIIIIMKNSQMNEPPREIVV